MEEDGLSINISSYGNWNSEKPQKRNSMSKREWLQFKRTKKRAEKDEEAPAETTSLVPEDQVSGTGKKSAVVESGSHKPTGKTQPVSQRLQSREKATSSKFSALFTKNPDIPFVRSAAAKPSIENVFTGDGFKDLELHTFMVDNLEKKFGFDRMTTVQKASIPHIMEGRDVLIKSQTGSGKTLAYAVPIVQKLQALNPKINRGDGTFAIIIVPTRELAIQSCDTFAKLTRPFTWVVPGSLMGGEKRKAEKARLRKGINVLVATPGRLLDHLQHTDSLLLHHIAWVVIDEADRLLELGFEKTVREIIAILDAKAVQKRQTVLLSATLTSGVEQLAGMSLNDTLLISVSQDSVQLSTVQAESTAQHPAAHDSTATSTEQSQTKQRGARASETEAETFATPCSLEHQCVIVPSKLRLVTLAAFIMSKCKFRRKACKLVVFFSTQDLVEFHHRVFAKCLRTPAEEEAEEEAGQETDQWLFKLHGDMEQKVRTKVFQDFQETNKGVLLCTDVASRGLDLPNVEWIVQFQPPASSADYIHRVGRTARAGSQGQALLFLTPAEAEFVKVLNDQSISLTMVDMKSLFGFLRENVIQLLGTEIPKREIPRTAEESAIALQKKMEVFVDGHADTRTLARKAYQSFVRAYATYPAALRCVFSLKQVHLGHVAKSFCLAEAPTRIGAVVGAQAHRNRKRKKSSALFDEDAVSAKKVRLQKIRNNSEFDSGLDGVSTQAVPKKFQRGKKLQKGNKKKIKIR